MKITVVVGLFVGCLMFAGATHRLRKINHLSRPRSWPWTNAIQSRSTRSVGPDFCKNVTLGAFTTLSELFALAEAGTPDPGWDFEPDKLTIKQGTIVSVVDQGGEPHTFTEVKSSVTDSSRSSTLAARQALFPSAPVALKTSRWPGRESFRVATSISRAFRRASISSNAASIPGCAWK